MENLEILEPEFTGKGFQITQKIRRLDTGSGRYYVMENALGLLQPYMSVTTAIGASFPPSAFLLEWQRNQGGHEAYRYELKARADYGTFMHVCIGKYIEAWYGLPTAQGYLEGEYINVEALIADQLREFTTVPYKYIVDESEWKRKALLHIYSFAAFFQEKQVDILALEIPVANDNFLREFCDEAVAPLAGCIDLVCWLLFNGKPTLSIVDFKSGKDFHESHIRQLAIYRELWNAAYPDHQIEKIFNWRPNDWRDKPTYTLENQTPKKEANLKAINHALAAYFMHNPVKLPPKKLYAPIKRGAPVENFVKIGNEGDQSWD